MRLIVVPVSVVLFASLAIGAWAEGASSQTSTTRKKTSATHAASARKSTRRATKPAPKTSSAYAKHTIAPRVRRAAVVHHYAPQQPSQERFKEIQQALADKGYFTGTADGNWGPASIDALKRFQHDQNLVEDGKIGSLSLIALGLGPKRETAESGAKADPKTSEPLEIKPPETKIP